ncbi:MAG: DNA adenine methylase [Spirochaetales bacterium]|nr:DNA adenine methylase [Spirochaetales bacterium]
MYEQVLESDYLKKHIIAYIGNKRRLLPLIYQALDSIYEEAFENKVFVDLFAGSGSVSRLAKSLGFQVISNDWEYYSFVINSCYVGLGFSDIEQQYGSIDCFKEELEYINSLDFDKADNPYISVHYSPSQESQERKKFKGQRLFYTAENGRRIDTIREYIRKNYETEPQPFDNLIKRNLLLGVLLYKSATHTNTSGVFKSFYKDFGGFNNDALSRILMPIELELPFLRDSKSKQKVFREDANTFIDHTVCRGVDVLYLDPPYNQHQYGSNYHMLNSIALWDRPDVNSQLDRSGNLVKKSGIREDWRSTRSSYCYTKSAITSFQHLLERADAHYILLSYSTDGIIPFDKLIDICKTKGKIQIFSNQYTTCRGGRQSNFRKINNIEFVIIIDTQANSSKQENEHILKDLQMNKIALIVKNTVNPDRLKSVFDVGAKISKNLTKNKLFLEMENELRCDSVYFATEPTIADIKEAECLLESVMCETREEELDVFIRMSLTTGKKEYIRKIPYYLKKISHKKYREIFEQELKKIERLIREDQRFSVLEPKIFQIKKIARKRIPGFE